MLVFPFYLFQPEESAIGVHKIDDERRDDDGYGDCQGDAQDDDVLSSEYEIALFGFELLFEILNFQIRALDVERGLRRGRAAVKVLQERQHDRLDA